MNETPKITLNKATHRETPVGKVEFAWNRELIDALKARTNVRWSASMNCWYIPKDKFDLGKFFTAMRPVTWIDYSAVLARELSHGIIYRLQPKHKNPHKMFSQPILCIFLYNQKLKI